MASIPVNTSLGQIIGLDVQPAADGSGNYVWVVRLDNADIEIGIVDVKQTYNVTPPVVENGGTIGFQSDVNGNLKVNIADLPALATGLNAIGGVYAAATESSAFAITPGSSYELETAHVLKAEPGNLYSLYVVTTAVGGYLMTFDATTIPSDGAVQPLDCIPVPASSIVSISADGSAPDSYSNGIVVVFSTTGPFTKTSSPTAFFRWSVK